MRKIRIGFALAVLLFVVRGAIGYKATSEFRATAREVADSHAVLHIHEQLLGQLLEAGSAERGYLASGDPAYLPDCVAASELIPRDLEALKKAAEGDPEQQAILLKLDPLVKRMLENLKQSLAAQQTQGLEAAREAYAKSGDREVMAGIRALMIASGDHEQALLEKRIAFYEKTARSIQDLLFVGTSMSLLLLGAGTWLIIRDVHARRKAEEDLAQERNLLHTLIETIPHRIYVKDLQSRFVLDNAAHRNHLGVKGVEEVMGKKAIDFYPAEFATMYQESDDKVMQTGTAVVRQEEPAVDREGNLIWLATTKVPLRDTAGKVSGIVCMSEDITELKHSIEKLRYSATQMERSNKELEEFASIASHDLQEPLRKIMAFGHRLKTKCGEALGADGTDYLDRMQNAARRMQVLIDDLLTLSRVSKRQRVFELVNLAKIARDVMSDLELLIEQTGASVELGHLPVIEADALQMRQLFQNLIGNALKFRKPDEKPIVSISAKVFEMSDYQLPGAVPGMQACQIAVQDNGIGFSSQYAEKIFAMFQRLHGKSEYEGSGIGLAVCRKITDRHGGTIMAKSSEGDGATFIVVLPVKQERFHQ